LNISMIYGGEADAKQNSSESERTRSHKNETPPISGCQMLVQKNAQCSQKNKPKTSPNNSN